MMSRFVLGLGNQGAPYTLYDMADDVHLLIEKMGLGQVYVLGASMGGMIAQILAARYPDKVKKWAYCLPVITSHCYPAFSKATL